MRMWLCNRKFTTVGEVLTKPLTASQVGVLGGGVREYNETAKTGILRPMTTSC